MKKTIPVESVYILAHSFSYSYLINLNIRLFEKLELSSYWVGISNTGLLT